MIALIMKPRGIKLKSNVAMKVLILKEIKRFLWFIIVCQFLHILRSIAPIKITPMRARIQIIIII